MKYKIKRLPIYHSKIGICVTNSVEELEKLFSKESIDYLEFEDIYAHAIIANHKGYQCFTIVLNFHNQFSGSITHGTIAHEANHIKNMILSYKGVHPDFSNDENASYVIEYIVDFIYKNLKKWKLLNQVKIKI